MEIIMMMSQLVRRTLLAMMVVAISGCSGLQGSSAAKGDSSMAAPVAEKPRYAATIHVLPYVDERKASNPRKIGVGAENLSGLSGLNGTDILLEQDVAAVVTGAIKKRLDDAGYQVVDTGSAMFELSGAVKELTYNVKARDEVSIAVETTLKDTASGKVLWSGLVTEKANRFAGVMGNSMGDVVEYLQHELRIVTRKTDEAISAVLMAQRPELFNIAPGTKVIPGVTVLTPPASAVPAAAPIAPAAPHVSASKGLLVVTTEPSRAKVYVDDVYYGLSPLRLEMEPGVRMVTVKLAGYKKAVEKVSVRQGDTTEVELKLER